MTDDEAKDAIARAKRGEVVKRGGLTISCPQTPNHQARLQAALNEIAPGVAAALQHHEDFGAWFCSWSKPTDLGSSYWCDFFATPGEAIAAARRTLMAAVGMPFVAFPEADAARRDALTARAALRDLVEAYGVYRTPGRSVAYHGCPNDLTAWHAALDALEDDHE